MSASCYRLTGIHLDRLLRAYALLHTGDKGYCYPESQPAENAAAPTLCWSKTSQSRLCRIIIFAVLKAAASVSALLDVHFAASSFEISFPAALAIVLRSVHMSPLS